MQKEEADEPRNGASLSSLPIGEGPNGVALVNGTLYGEMPAYGARSSPSPSVVDAAVRIRR